ncbi:MAG TPA: serine/threonine-protein kinase [Gemmatimonadaceae bacterium]|nr:serine/threonine-protein kinase [Gemmatimonadaceae bacterium]
MPDLAEKLRAELGPNYSVSQEIGGGGMSRVFLARDSSLDRDVVVKVLRTSLAAAVSAERFRREIMVSAGLQHPNIVPVLSAGAIDSVPFFVMPYVRGESLRARMERGPLSIRETISIMRDVARGLAMAHERRIIHRDIKPDNILLSGGAASVTDFGVAKAVSDSRRGGDNPQGSTMTGVGISLGTPAYMAPEQAAADPHLDHRADLYSLGIVAYEMLAGAPPFHGRSAQAVLSAHLTERPKPIRSRRYDVPGPLVALIESCLEKEPAQRPRTAAEIVRALETIDVSSGAFSAATDRLRREWRRYVPHAILAILMIAAVAWGLGGGEPEAPATVPAASVAPPRPAMSLAVQPIRAIGGDARTAAVAEGLTAELAARLSQVPGFRITSGERAGAADSMAASSPLPSAREAELIVDGTVRQERNRLRASVRIVSVRTDSTSWAGVYEGSTDSVFAFQSRIAEAASAALRGVRPGG